MKEQIEKQAIEEMAKVLKDYTKKKGIMASHVILEDYAEALYNAGCRKQSEGEWKTVYRMVGSINSYPALIPTNKEFCSICKKEFGMLSDVRSFKYCPNCGAKMKGGAE